MEGVICKRNKEAEKYAKNYSIVHWQKGEPKENGASIITTDEGTVSLASFFLESSVDMEFFKIVVTAWCKLSDIGTYKEETK